MCVPRGTAQDPLALPSSPFLITAQLVALSLPAAPEIVGFLLVDVSLSQLFCI